MVHQQLEMNKTKLRRTTPTQLTLLHQRHSSLSQTIVKGYKTTCNVIQASLTGVNGRGAVTLSITLINSDLTNGRSALNSLVKMMKKLGNLLIQTQKVEKRR